MKEPWPLDNLWENEKLPMTTGPCPTLSLAAHSTIPYEPPCWLGSDDTVQREYHLIERIIQRGGNSVSSHLAGVLPMIGITKSKNRASQLVARQLHNPVYDDATRIA
jgi:hypothetical protein